MKRKPLKGSWILAFLFCVSVIASAFQNSASAADNNQLVFAYQTATVYQEVSVSTAGKSELTLTVSAAETQDWKPSSDLLNIGIALYGAGGGLIYQHSTGNVAIDSGQFSNYSISVSEAGVGTGGWSSVTTARAFIIGQDGEFWAGNYGTRIESASLKFDDNIELLSNTEFTSNSSWTSSSGWQSCSGGIGNQPCINIAVPPTTTTTTTIPINNSNYTLGIDMVWGTVNENGNLNLTAPGGGIFTQVIFASYGTPSGSNGVYTQGSCHAINSIQKVSQIFIGNSSGTIGASNGVFGDPCGGTYKNLRVVLKYTGGLPNTTTTTTTTLPTCGPYPNITVTGKLNGAVWGSGPYTDDSDFGVAAVHAGLAEVGETVTIVPSNVSYYLSYPGSTANAVTTLDWLSGWCGYDIGPLFPPTTTTTTVPETTTTTEPEQTTTTQPEEDETTTTVEPEPESTTTTTEPEQQATTTTTEPEITPSVTTTTEPEPEPVVESTPEPDPQQNEDSQSPTDPEPEEETSTSVAQEEPSLEEETPETIPENTNDQSDENNTDDQIVTTEELESAIDEVISGDADPEQVAELLSSDSLTEEQVQEAVDQILEAGIDTELAIELITNTEVLENLSTEQIQEILDAVLEEEISTELAQELATSPEVLQNITGEQAAEVFAAVDVGELTEEAKSEITAAVQDAPEEVRNAFEGEINIYAAGFDDYVPVGSTIDVASRRTLLAATTVLATAAAASVAGGSGPSSGGSRSRSGGPSSGGSSGGTGPTGGENSAARKEEEEGSEDEEEAPEIEGPDGDGGDETFSKNSIFKYTEGTMEKRFSPWGFMKKFARETAALAFTISGTVIVFATLSGDTRKITVIATSCAFVIHYINAMLQNDE